MIVYPVCAFHDQWLSCLVSIATLNLKKKRNFNDYSSKTTKAVGLLFGTNVKWVRAIGANLPLGLVAMATKTPIDLQ